jgi:hypothetical protein
VSSEATKTFNAGDRIRIAETYHWAQGALGTIQPPPAAVRNFAPGWTGIRREMIIPSGKRYCYWVVFDEPHDDGSGDGPYHEAEVPVEHLQHAFQ